MNYYERHIGDYLKDTAHLSLLEHGVYTRLLDVYYTREGALPQDQVARLIGARSKDERAAMQAVLDEFFVLVDGAYSQRRCDREVARLQDKRRKASASANARWEKRESHSDGNANASANASANAHAADMRTHSDGNARAPVPSLQTPDTNNPPTPDKRGSSVHGFPPGFESFWSAYPRKTAKPKAAQAFARLKPDASLLAAMLAAIAAQATWEQWTKDGGQFIPHPATWLNGRRWEDQAPTAAASAKADDIFAGAH